VTPMNELERIVALTRTEVERRRRALAAEDLAREAAGGRMRAGAGPSLTEALSRPGLALIAEHKRRSPSAGVIRDGVPLEQVIAAYERGGAAALSILTEGPSFGGSLDDLRAARAASELPILRKDFIVDRYQIDEAVAAGADAILLIVAALSLEELTGLRLHASHRGLDALVEVHDERELESALEAGATVVGINNRDLATLDVDKRRTSELLPLIPEGTVAVAESGFSRPYELEELRDAGVDAVLVGEALMRAPDIEIAVRTLTSRRPSVG
jgi:indole-3-glycerol phosphate synthase